MMPSRSLTLAYWACALIYIFFSGQLSGGLLIIHKVLPILLLLLMVGGGLQGRLKWGMVAAVAFSALGDILLALEADQFIAGLGSFLVAQLIYAAIFWSRRSTQPLRKWLVVAFLPFIITMGFFVLPASGSLAVPVAAYLVAISIMVTGAAISDRPWQWLFMGAFSFAVSDSLIAINKFIQPIPHESVWIMGSYYLAQYLMVNGVIRGEKKR